MVNPDQARRKKAGGSGRYDRQVLLPDIGSDGQRKLADATVLIVGCGALGCGVADQLARAGVGTLRIVDRDVVEISNLQRQTLYSQADADRAAPKAMAAAARLGEINPDIRVEPVTDDFRASNAESLAAGVDLLVDGLDNFDTRYLLNDLAVKHGLPYVYAGAVGTGGLVMPILPKGGGQGQAVSWDAPTPCLRCIFPEPPPAGASPTCDTAGVLGPTIAIVTGHQAAAALSLLVGRVADLDRSMHSIDPWAGEDRRMRPGTPRQACPCCGQRRFEWLDGERGGAAESLCGRDTTQILPAAPGPVDLDALAARLNPHGEVRHDQHVLQVDLTEDRVRVTVFADGRALIGVGDPARARTLYDRWVGA
ncbi:MAG: ThiF family adenylyltransferase [Phycisphaerales bacterium]|nr:ThiF family adenylyltransferase [Phycisphaerales bacterium]